MANTFASTSETTLRFAPTTGIKVVPTTGNHYELPIMSESLAGGLEKSTSGEINTGRVERDMQITKDGASGDIKTRVRYNTFDAWYAALMGSTCVEFGTRGLGVATTVDATATTLTAASAPTGTSAFTNLQKGQWFKVESAGANDNKYLRVSSTTAPTSTVITLDAGTPAVVSTGESIQISTSRITNGVDLPYMVFERDQTDIDAFFHYLGIKISKFSLSINYGDMSEQTFSLMGGGEFTTDTTVLPGTTVLPPDFDVHTHNSDVFNAFWLNGTPFTATSAQKLDFNFDNKITSSGAIYNGAGPAALTGRTIEAGVSLTLYLADRSFHQKLRTNEDLSLIFSSVDSAGNGYIFTIPRLKVKEAKTNASSKDQDMMLTLELTLLQDKATGKALFIDRVGAAAVL